MYAIVLLLGTSSRCHRRSPREDGCHHACKPPLCWLPGGQAVAIVFFFQTLLPSSRGPSIAGDWCNVVLPIHRLLCYLLSSCPPAPTILCQPPAAAATSPLRHQLNAIIGGEPALLLHVRSPSPARRGAAAVVEPEPPSRHPLRKPKPLMPSSPLLELWFFIFSAMADVVAEEVAVAGEGSV